MIYNESTKADKVIPIICVIVLAAFITSVPSMVNDQNKRLEQAWQDQGCHMYDNYQLAKVPAKCQTLFVDHYQAQPARTQPNQEEK